VQEERERYMDNLERQMEEQREQIQRTLDRTTEDSDRGWKVLKKAPELPSQLPRPHPSAGRCGAREAHRADPKRNILSRRGKSPEALRASVLVAAHVRRLIGGATRCEGGNQGHGPRRLRSSRGGARPRTRRRKP
jgi:hypothetical protein